MIVAAPRPLPAQLVDLGIFRQPPAYTRLEPQSLTGDPTPGIAAAVHDPLWNLFRQWQVGEFAGEDAGTPLAVTIATTSQPLTLFAYGSPGGTALAGNALPGRATLDRAIEAEKPPAAGQGSRQRIEAAATLVAALKEAGLDVASTLAKRYPFAVGATGVLPRKALGIMLRGADAEAIAAAMEGGTPDWLVPGSADAQAAAKDWLGWYRTNVAPPSGGECWDPKRLEYHFSVASDAGTGQTVFTAPMHLGGDVDWYELDQVPRTTMSGPAGPALPPAAAPPTTLVAPLRFAGMPADRFWEFEDALVNLGAMNVQINDPARLCLIEFATVYGCDWYVAPIEVSASSFTTISRMTVMDTFGVTIDIPRAGTGSGNARFRLYEPNLSQSTETARGLLTVGGARAAMEGPPRETVYFLRDETANMVWAVEATVEDASGLTRSRQDEVQPVVTYPPPDPQAELRYTLETLVPAHWIPMVPVPMAGVADGFVLRKATMSAKDDSVGQVLAGKPRDIFDTEVPRTGVRVSRVPTLARDASGKLLRWTSCRVGDGYGGISSNLASDQTTPVNQS